MGNPSFYYTLFKKFQVMGHVHDAEAHGRTDGPPPGEFNLRDPGIIFFRNPSQEGRGPLLGLSKQDSPLWAVLNARANGAPGLSDVLVGDDKWPAMPEFDTEAWLDFQINAPAPNKLVDVFGNWINAGKVRDWPEKDPSLPKGSAGVESEIPFEKIKELDPGVSVFVCSMPFGSVANTRPRRKAFDG